MRDIQYLVLHTTASNPNWTPNQVQEYFLRPVAKGGRGWKTGGYHWLIDSKGEAVRMYDDEVVTNGVLPYNKGDIRINNLNSVHVTWIGGIDDQGKGLDNRTAGQKSKLRTLVNAYLQKYPNIKVLGHNQVAAKACPCFWVPIFCLEMGLKKDNIYEPDNMAVLKSRPWRTMG